MKKKELRKRTQSGQSTVVLMLVLAAFVIAPLGFLGVEISRYFLCKTQLKACIESAALAAAAANASSNTFNVTQTHQNAQTFAVNMLWGLNSIMGVNLDSTNCILAGTKTQQATANQTLIWFQWYDTQGNAQPASSATAKILQVQGTFGYVPAFSSMLGGPVIGPFQAVELANGGLPMLDFIMCFDVSSSMDDYTFIALVERFKSSGHDLTNLAGQPQPAAGKAAYQLVPYQGHQASDWPVADNGFGHIYDTIWCTWELGSSINGSYPQSCDATPFNQEGVYTFDQGNRLNQGASQGNTNPSNASLKFTDLVVMADTTATNTDPSMMIETDITIAGGGVYKFPAGWGGLYTAVEAARGNLESPALAASAGVDTALFATFNPPVTARPGWLAAYQQYMADFNHVQPIGNAMQAAANFFTIMNNDCDAHFGFIAFSSGVASTQNGTMGWNGDIASGFTPAGIGGYPQQGPFPGIKLNNAFGSTNYNAVEQAVGAMGGLPLVANGGTDTPDALKQAIDWLLDPAQFRPGAKKAALLFTDGLPNGGGDSWSGGAENWPNSQAQASRAQANNIPIYTIGLCMPTGTIPGGNLQAIQQQVLTDAPGSNGIAALSGGHFFQVTSNNPNLLNIAFENVARSLCQLVTMP